MSQRQIENTISNELDLGAGVSCNFVVATRA